MSAPVDHNDAATVPRSLVLQLTADLPKRSIRDMPGKAVVLHHRGDEQDRFDVGDVGEAQLNATRTAPQCDRSNRC
jgi:hypothetical protein